MTHTLEIVKIRLISLGKELKDDDYLQSIFFSFDVRRLSILYLWSKLIIQEYISQSEDNPELTVLVSVVTQVPMKGSVKQQQYKVDKYQPETDSKQRDSCLNCMII